MAGGKPKDVDSQRIFIETALSMAYLSHISALSPADPHSVRVTDSSLALGSVILAFFLLVSLIRRPGFFPRLHSCFTKIL